MCSMNASVGINGAVFVTSFEGFTIVIQLVLYFFKILFSSSFDFFVVIILVEINFFFFNLLIEFVIDLYSESV